MSTEDQSRSEFEARSQHSKRLLWKRGGSVFAENIPESDYVDVGVQRDWLLWRESWQASRRTERASALEEAAKVCEGIAETSFFEGSSADRCVDAIRALAALAVETKEG